MHKYRLVAKKGEGTFSEVLKAQCIKNGKYVAIKCMKNHFDSLDQVNNLREIQALRRLSPHPHIIKLVEVLYDQPTGRLALVFELMDMNIYELIRGRRHYVAEERIKAYMYQLMKSMDHMHRNGIFHRDIKPENILIMDDCLKLADFGSCRGIYSKQPYTEYISTRWYRAPECLLTDGYYNYKMDMWGVGCVFFEIVSLFPLFPGTNELDQIQKIHNIMGTPPPELLAKMKKRSQHMDFNFPPKEGTGIPKLIPHVPAECVDLICKLLAYNPDDRLSARQALRHPYFKEIREAEKRQKAMMSPDSAGAAASEPAMTLPPSMPPPSVPAGAVPEPSKQGSMVGAGHRGMSPGNGSDTEEGAGGHGPTSPSDTNRQSESSVALGLPSISKHHHTQEHHHLSDGAPSDGFRLTDAASVAGDDGSLPPIGNLSLGKANMAANSTGRRGTLPNYLAKGAVQGVATAGSNGAVPKRQPGMPAAGGKYSNKAAAAGGAGAGSQGHKDPAAGAAAAPVAGAALATQSSVGKYGTKANAANAPAAASKGGSKYISPYSLRNLAVKEQA